ncbi:HNH endonuclease [Aminipila sp.]|uniref:HNH endonuclease n=1 Tax=Aminipila sp. TaxID=2060095 RepID=UPI002899CCB5|nr:HNH endonuclease [Aminipila sp.]
MKFCYVCEKEITQENQSVEHIIPNAIGGKLKSKALLCKKCNSELGDSIDSELSKQLNHICNMLNIKRERGMPQAITGINTKTGEQVMLEPGGKPSRVKPIINEEVSGKGKHIHVTARNKKEAKSILKGLRRKYPQINVDEIIKNTEVKREYIEDRVQLNITIGGQECFRSICKTAVNFYMFTGGKQEYIQDLIPYIKGDTDTNRVYFFYNDEEVISKGFEQIVHGLVLRGDTQEKVLYMYIEYFNAFKFLILINDSYDGDEVNEAYVFDVLNQTEIKPIISLNIKKQQIIKTVTEKSYPGKMLSRELNQIMTIIMNKQRKEVLDAIILRAFDNSLMKYPDGVIITEEMADETVSALMKELTPWIIHNLK